MADEGSRSDLLVHGSNQVRVLIGMVEHKVKYHKGNKSINVALP